MMERDKLIEMREPPITSKRANTDILQERNGERRPAIETPKRGWRWSFWGSLSRDMGIDLGTANTLVYVRGRGVVLREPSVVAIRKDHKQALAVGAEAKDMIGKTPGNIVAIRPLKDGVIADFDTAEVMLKHFIAKVHERGRLMRPRMVIGIPSGVTGVERRAVMEAAFQAGAREVYLIEEPMAAAIGAGLPVAEPTGCMVVDIGGGTTEVAVISLGGVVAWRSIKVGGYEMDEAIARQVQSRYGLLIGGEAAEEAKLEAGSAWPLEEELDCSVGGRDLHTGMLRRLELGSEELRHAVDGPVQRIVAA